MELKQRKSRFGNKICYDGNGIRRPISSAEYAFLLQSSTIARLPDPAAQQHQLLPSPTNHYSKTTTNRGDSVIAKMMKLGESMDIFAQTIREHVRLGQKLSETVKGKLSLGVRILQVGGVEKVFMRKFDIRDDEKLFKAFQCYLSTTAGPIAGLLFVSNNRVAFCSERSISIKCSSTTGKLLKLHYKVMIPLTKIRRVNERENVMKPRHKYVQLVTEDNYDFWFMGFLNHQKTLKYLQMAIHQAR